MNRKTRKAFLDVRKRFESVRESYALSGSQYLNILLYGDFGTGKTQALSTAPKPIHIDSFDPGGTKTSALQSLIERGDIIVDNRYERDDWKKPEAYANWRRELRDREREGYFDYIGTYCVDSITRWALSMMYEIMSKGSKIVKPHPGGTPVLQDYLLQQFNGASVLNQLMSLPCHVIVTGHITRSKDEVTGKMETGLMLAGKFSDQTPLAFDEKYVTRVDSGKHVIQTKHDGYFSAESRIGGSVFKQFEEPNLQKMMRKANANKEPGSAGYIAWEDKTPIYELEEPPEEIDA